MDSLIKDTQNFTPVAEETFLEPNGEEFTRIIYNNIQVIRHERTGFLNATRLCEDAGKRFRKLEESDNLKEILKSLSIFRPAPIRAGLDEMICNEKGIKFDNNYIYQLSDEIYSEPVRGRYVFPILIHNVADFCSSEYSIKVAIMMAEVDKRSHLLNISLDQTINNYIKENEELKAEKKLLTEQQNFLEKHEKELEKHEKSLEKENEELEEIKDDLDEKIEVGHVRVPINQKRLTIFKKDNNKYYLSANSTKHFIDYRKVYIFPATMNVRQMVSKHFHKKGFSKEELPELEDFLRDLNPKDILLKFTKEKREKFMKRNYS
jgi:hypothetical protein